jgi:hypothetical protein
MNKKKEDILKARNKKEKKPAKIFIKDIQIRNDLYPRTEVNEATVRKYAEDIDVLPPIVINQDKILIDGMHRLEAHKRKGIEEIEFIIEKIDGDTAILLRAVELNAKWGLQLSNKEKKQIALRLFNGTNSDKLIGILSVSKDCFNKWVRDKRQELQNLLEGEIINDYLKVGMTQQEITKKYEVHDTKITELKNKILKEINLFFSKQELPKDTDLEKYGDLLNFSPYPSDMWKDIIKEGAYSINNDYVDIDYKLYSENLLYYFSEPFDIVYTKNREIQETCKKWYRRYTENCAESPNMIIIEDNEPHIESLRLELEKNNNHGIIIIKVKVERDSKICGTMEKMGFSFVNRIVIPYPFISGKVEEKCLRHGYSTILVFKANSAGKIRIETSSDEKKQLINTTTNSSTTIEKQPKAQTRTIEPE